MFPTPLERDMSRALATRTKAINLVLPDPHRLPPNTAPDLFSNDYLSLATNAELRASFLSQCARHSHLFGSTGARLLTGNSTELIALEKRLADFFGAPSALMFNSGYDANVAFFSAVPGPKDILIMDELIHASAQDGITTSRLKKGNIYSFRHNNMASFQTCLSYVLDRHPEIKARKVTLFIAVESLYSMDGTFCPLRELLDIAESQVPKESLHVVIDEAHATGLFGPQGRGLAAALGVVDRVQSFVHTFGKARAFSGGSFFNFLDALSSLIGFLPSCGVVLPYTPSPFIKLWSSLYLHNRHAQLEHHCLELLV
jgi:8-amino-7-oxononanoate synthase